MKRDRAVESQGKRKNALYVSVGVPTRNYSKNSREPPREFEQMFDGIRSISGINYSRNISMYFSITSLKDSSAARRMLSMLLSGDVQMMKAFMLFW